MAKKSKYIRLFNGRYGEVNRSPNAMTKAEESAWVEWFKSVGIDPADVLLDGFVERDLEQNRVYYESYVRDSNGHYQVDSERRSLATTVCFVPCNGAPPEFPALSDVRGS